MSEQQTRTLARDRGRKLGATLVVLLLLIVVFGGAYAVTFAPEHYARAQEERVDGTDIISIGMPQEATVQPAASWSVRPVVTPLFSSLALFKDPRVMLDDYDGVHIESPNGELAVELRPLGDTDIDALFEVEAPIGTEAYREVLASGAQLRYVDVEDGDRGEVTGIVGSVRAGSHALLVRVTLDHDAEFTFDDYRPDVSELLESITQ